jgi:PAS domain S-box-containing protein
MNDAASRASRPGAPGRLAEACYRALFDTTPDVLLVADEDGRCVDVNDSLCRLLHQPRERLVGARFCDFVPAAARPAALAAFGELASAGALRREFPLCAADGTAVALEWTARAHFVPGLHLWVGRDVTERKEVEATLRESEARYRDLFENANDIIYTLDLDGRVTSVNKRAEQTFGYSRTEIFGRNAGELVPPEYHPRMQEALRRKLAGDVGPTIYEVEVFGRDGRRVPVEVSSRLIVRGGRPVGVQGIARDITERKRAEEALKEADRRKDEFLATLAHELRNPLAPIRTAAAILKELDRPEPRLAQVREMIERQVTHLARLVDDLLDVSRISRGRALLRKVRLDLVPLVGAAVEDHRPLLEGAGLKLSVELPRGPLWVEGDPTRLAQVVGNLLHNAHKFTDAGGLVAVRLSADEGGGTAALSVRDTGIGLGADILGRLFEPFSQADRSLARSRGGLGLGLALVKGLTELHGGAVRAHSPGAGLGSEFTVRLPLCARPSEAANESSERPARRKALRVLIIEDNRDAAESLRLLLQVSGHEAAAAHTGAEGVTTAREFRPDVVLCDIGLPGGMDGYDVARALRADPELSAVTLLALSGYGQEEDRRRARQAGFDRHLTKPVDPQALMELLASAVPRVA